MAKKIIKNKKINTVTNDPYLIADKIIIIGLFIIWGALLVFGIFTLTQPQWLINLSKKGRTEEALTNITAGNSYLYQANEKKSEALYQKALINYQTALKIDTGNYEARANMGITYLYLNQLDEAKATFEKCLITDTTDAHHSYAYLGDIYERKGDLEKAFECYLNSAKKHPNPSYPLRKAGLLCEQLKKPDDAVKYLKQAIELEKSFGHSYKATLMDAGYKLTKDKDTFNLEIISKELQKPDFTEDVRRYDKIIFEQMLKKSKDLGYAYMYLGDAYFSKSQFDSAYISYQQSLTYNSVLIERIKDKQAFAYNQMALHNEKK